jgi:PAS domain S-box-containing protein
MRQLPTLEFPNLPYPFARTAKWRILIAVVTTGIALLITVAGLRAFDEPVMLMFAAAVVVTALLAGVRGGCLATILSAGCILFFLVPPKYSFAVRDGHDGMRLALFTAVGLVLSWIVGQTAEMQRRLSDGLREKTRLVARVSELASIVESSHDAIFSQRLDGTITSWNQAAEEMYGYTAEEATGRNAAMLVPEEHAAAEEQRMLRQVGRGERMPHHDAERLRKDGSRVRVSLVISPVRDEHGRVIGASSIARDITLAKSKEEALRHSEAELRTLSEAIPHMVWKANGAGQTQYFNRRWYDYTGLTEEEAMGWDWQPALHPDDLPEALQQWRSAVQTGSTFEVEYRLRRADSTYRWHLARAVPMRNESGQVVEWFGTCTDIHDFKQAQAILMATEKAVAMGRMAGNIAHEINNPLAAITNLVVLLSHKKLDDFEARHYLSMLSHEVARVVHITRQTLGFYQESQTPLPVDLGAAVKDVLGLYGKEIAAQEIKVETAFGGDTLVEAFPAEVRHLLSNLVLNAIEAVGRNGRIQIAIVDAAGKADKVMVTISDNGPGIPAGIAEKIFEPFFSTKGEKGTGLGLWVSRGIVARHGGELQFSSTTEGAEHGTTFMIVLPKKFGEEGEGAKRGAA